MYKLLALKIFFILLSNRFPYLPGYSTNWDEDYIFSLPCNKLCIMEVTQKTVVMWQPLEPLFK
jgi:hypothetical protein